MAEGAAQLMRALLREPEVIAEAANVVGMSEVNARVPVAFGSVNVALAASVPWRCKIWV